MFDRDISKVLVGEIAETREVEIGCDECFEQLDRFVQAAYVVDVPTSRTLR
jgi:hypothetical protein